MKLHGRYGRAAQPPGRCPTGAVAESDIDHSQMTKKSKSDVMAIGSPSNGGFILHVQKDDIDNKTTRSAEFVV